MPLAGICGRVCNHPCENMCKRGEIDEPLAIASLKRFASDWERNQNKMAPAAFVEKMKEARVPSSAPARPDSTPPTIWDAGGTGYPA